MPDAKFITLTKKEFSTKVNPAPISGSATNINLREGAKFIFIPQFTGFITPLDKVKWTFNTSDATPNTWEWTPDSLLSLTDHTISGEEGYKSIFGNTDARLFNGSTGYVYFDITNNPLNDPTNGFIPGSSPLTLGGWFKQTAKDTGENYQSLISKGYTVHNNGTSILSITMSGNAASNFYIQIGGGQVSIVPHSIVTGEWFHIALSIPDNDKATFYINGELISSSIEVGTSGNESRVMIGASYTNSALSTKQFYFKGVIDEMFFYDRNLSKKEISTLYNLGDYWRVWNSEDERYIENLKHYYTFDSAFLDSVGGVNGKKAGGVSTYTYSEGDVLGHRDFIGYEPIHSYSFTGNATFSPKVEVWESGANLNGAATAEYALPDTEKLYGVTSDFNIINSAVISRAAIDSEEDVTSDSLDQGILYKKKGSTERIYKHLVLPSDSVGQVISADEDGDLVWVDNDFGSGAGLWLQGNLDADGADLNNSAYYPGDVGSVTSGVYFPGYVSIGSEFKDGDLNRSSSSDPFNLSVDRLNVREELFAASLAFDNIQATSIDATNATIATIAVSDSLTIGGNNVLTDATDIIRYAGSTAQYGDVVYYSGILNIGISILDNSATNYITDEYYGTSSNSPFYNPGSPDGQMNLHNTYSPIISGHSPVTLSITNEPLNLGDPDTEFDPLYSIDHDNNATWKSAYNTEETGTSLAFNIMHWQRNIYSGGSEGFIKVKRRAAQITVEQINNWNNPTAYEINSLSSESEAYLKDSKLLVGLSHSSVGAYDTASDKGYSRDNWYKDVFSLTSEGIGKLKGHRRASLEIVHDNLNYAGIGDDVVFNYLPTNRHDSLILSKHYMANEGHSWGIAFKGIKNQPSTTEGNEAHIWDTNLDTKESNFNTFASIHAYQTEHYTDIANSNTLFKGGLDFEVNIPDYDLKKTPLKLYTNYNDLGDLTSAWNQTTVKAESLLTLSSLQFHSVLDPSDISVSGLEQMTQSGVVIMTEENNTSDLEFYTGSQWKSLTTITTLEEDLNASNYSISGVQTVQFEIEVSNTGTPIDWNSGQKQNITLSGDITLYFTDTQGIGNFLLVIKQDDPGGHTITWDNNVKWAGGTAPTLSTGANAIDILSFYFDGTTYYGVASLDFS